MFPDPDGIKTEVGSSRINSFGFPVGGAEPVSLDGAPGIMLSFSASPAFHANQLDNFPALFRRLGSPHPGDNGARR